MKNLQEFIMFEYGREVEDATQTQLRHAINETGEVVDYSEKLAKKAASKAYGIDISDLEMRPALLFGCKSRSVFTDGYLLVTDKEAADQINDDVIEKHRKRRVKKAKKELPGESYEEIVAYVNNSIKKGIERYGGKSYPETQRVLDRAALDAKPLEKMVLTPGGGTRNTVMVGLENDNGRVFVDLDKLNFIERYLGEVEYRTRDKQPNPVAIYKDDKLVGAVMPIKPAQNN